MAKRSTVEQVAVTRQQAKLNSLREQLAAERRRNAALKARYEVAAACAKAHENWHHERC